MTKLTQIHNLIEQKHSASESIELKEQLHIARDFALIAHAPSKYGQQPYIVHLDDVVLNVIRHEECLDLSNMPPIIVSPLWKNKHQRHFKLFHFLQGAYLHDTLEDTLIFGKRVTYSDLSRKYGFSEQVCELAYAVSDGKGRNRKERKKIMYNDISAFPQSIPLKLADMIANTNTSLSEFKMGINKIEAHENLSMYIEDFPKFSERFRDDKYDSLWQELECNIKEGREILPPIQELLMK